MSAIIGAVNGGIIGLVVGAGLGLLHYPILSGMYTEHQRMLYDDNGGVIFITGIGGGIGGCIGGAISGFNSSIIMNDSGISGGLTGGALGGFVGSVGSIIIDSNK
jgi:hypothetical protein